MSDLTRDVQLRLSVKNNTQQDFKTLTDQVNALTAAVKAETEAAATGAVKQAELAESLKRLTDAGKGIQQLAQDIQAYQNSFRQIEDAGKRLDVAAAKLNEFEASGSRNVRTLGRLQNAYGAAFTNLDRLTQQQAALATGLNNAGINTDDLTGEMTRLLAVAGAAGAGIKALDAAISNYTKNVRLHNEATKQEKEAAEAATRAENERAAAVKAVAEAMEQVQSRVIARDRAASAQEVSIGVAKFKEEQAEKIRVAEEAARKIKEAQDIQIRAAVIEQNLQLQMTRARLKTEADERAKALAAEKEAAVVRMIQQKQFNDEQATLNAQSAREQAEVERRERLGARGRAREDRQKDLAERQAASRELQFRLRRDAQEEERAGRSPARTGEQTGRNFLGLRAYEMTNLGYQGVDVLQGLLAGTSGGIIAAQQGPQIVQIFGLGILKWTPIIVAGLGAIAVAWGGFSRVLREQESTREFASLLTDNANAIRYTVTQLNDIRKAARDMGISWADAGTAIRNAVDNNIAQDRLKQLLQIARDVNITTGKSVPDAMKDLTAAFSSSGEELLKLNDSFNFLSRTELDYARRQIESGNAEEARRFVIERLSKTLRDRADVLQGPWSKALQQLSNSWDNFLVTISKTEGFQTANNWLLKIIDSLSALIKKIDELSIKGGLGHTLLGALVGPNSVVARAVEGIRSTLGLKPLDWSGTPFATEAGAAPGGTLAPGITGNQKIVADFLSSRGYNASQAAAIMGNIAIESSFNPAAVGPLGHQGIVQWDQPRRTALGVSTSSPLLVQLEALDKELTALDPTFKQSTQNFIELTRRFRDVFERPIRKEDIGKEPDIRDLAARTARAREFYAPPQTTTSATAADAGRAAPVSTGPTPAQIREGQRQLADAERQRAIDTARTIELERQARYRQAEAEINVKEIDDESKRGEIRIARAKIDQDLFMKQQALEQKREGEKITFARHYNEVVEAGNKAVAEALKQQNLSWEQQEAVRDRAQQKEFDRLSRIDQQNKAFDAAVKTVNDLERSLRGAFGPDMEGRLAARGVQFDDIIKQLKELREAATLTDKDRITGVINRVEGLRPLGLFEERGKVLQEQARDAVVAREALIAANKAAQEAGAISISEQQDRDKKAFELTKTAIDDATAALDEWIETGKKMGYSTIALEKTRSEVQKLRIESEYVDPLWKGLVKTAEDSFGTRAVEAFDSVAESIGNAIAKTKEWKDVWVDMGKAAANFFAGVLKDIASYIIKAELAKALSSFIPSLGSFPGVAAGSAGAAGAGAAATGGLSSGWTSIFSGAAAVAHEGGVVGSSALPMRNAPGGWFAGAPRYHTGGIVGLAANEQQAILQKGEEVLTADNPRNIVNLTRNETHHEQPRDINIRNVLVADPDLVPSHMGSARGEKVIMSVLTKNAATVRQLVR